MRALAGPLLVAAVGLVFAWAGAAAASDGVGPGGQDGTRLVLRVEPTGRETEDAETENPEPSGGRTTGTGPPGRFGPGTVLG
ncbi:MAG: hypothetical protein LBG60_08820 [Bifidobacteriaceae bacterium]|nr:hypothetical protein [Bifidobacteriaceae bacterium]